MTDTSDITQFASQLLNADQETAHAIVSGLVVNHGATLTLRADKPGGTALFTWREITGESEIGHVEAARDWAAKFLNQPESDSVQSGPKGQAGVDNGPLDPFTRLTDKRNR